MLESLVAKRNELLNNYYMQESIFNLGLYNKSVKDLKNYIAENDVKYDGSIDPKQVEFDAVSREKYFEGDLDLSLLDLENIDYILEL